MFDVLDFVKHQVTSESIHLALLSFLLHATSSKYAKEVLKFAKAFIYIIDIINSDVNLDCEVTLINKKEKNNLLKNQVYRLALFIIFPLFRANLNYRDKTVLQLVEHVHEEAYNADHHVVFQETHSHVSTHSWLHKNASTIDRTEEESQEVNIEYYDVNDDSNLAVLLFWIFFVTYIVSYPSMSDSINKTKNCNKGQINA